MRATIAVALIAMGSVWAARVEAAPPQRVSFQARVTDASNNSVADGTHSIIFRLYDETNTVRWTET